MSDSKKYYDKALKELRRALTNLERAQKSFNISSLNMDDFPTARHEIMDLANKTEAIFEKTDILFLEAVEGRIR